MATDSPKFFLVPTANDIDIKAPSVIEIEDFRAEFYRTRGRKLPEAAAKSFVEQRLLLRAVHGYESGNGSLVADLMGRLSSRSDVDKRVLVVTSAYNEAMLSSHIEFRYFGRFTVVKLDTINTLSAGQMFDIVICTGPCPLSQMGYFVTVCRHLKQGGEFYQFVNDHPLWSEATKRVTDYIQKITTVSTLDMNSLPANANPRWVDYHIQYAEGTDNNAKSTIANFIDQIGDE